MIAKAFRNQRLRESGLFLEFPELFDFKLLDSVPLPEGRRYVLLKNDCGQFSYAVVEVSYSGAYKLLRTLEGERIDSQVLLFQAG